MPDLSIPKHILDEIVAHARELAPFECCGLLAGTNKTVTHLYRITNIVAVEGAEKLSTFDDDEVAISNDSPRGTRRDRLRHGYAGFLSRQERHPQERARTPRVYHSHPKDPARPSHTDIKIASDYEEIWQRINLPIPAYLLVSLMHEPAADIRTYWITGGHVRPADIHIV